ncbi:MAG: hypothetical protein WBD27_18195 [Pyrinomonadaceae bacterium]
MSITPDSTGAVEKTTNASPAVTTKMETPSPDTRLPDSLPDIESLFPRKIVVRVVMHLMLALGVLIAIIGSSFFFASRAESLGNEWVANLRPGKRPADDKNPLLPAIRNIVNPDLPPAITLTPTQQDRMQNQLDDVRKKAKHHLDVAVYYYSQSFMAILAFSLAAALGAISLAIISKRGLDGVSEYVVTMFLVATALALFYQSFPGVFQQRKNVEDNRALYIRYVNLEDDMISYVATGSITVKQTVAAPDSSRPTKPEQFAKQLNSNVNSVSATPILVTVNDEYSIVTLSPVDFIHYIDHQLKKYNDVAIGFDESKAANFAKEQFQTQ